jgi:hypothetical protein
MQAAMQSFDQESNDSAAKSRDFSLDGEPVKTYELLSAHENRELCIAH